MIEDESFHAAKNEKPSCPQHVFGELKERFRQKRPLSAHWLEEFEAVDEIMGGNLVLRYGDQVAAESLQRPNTWLFLLEELHEIDSRVSVVLLKS